MSFYLYFAFIVMSTDIISICTIDIIIMFCVYNYVITEEIVFIIVIVIINFIILFFINFINLFVTIFTIRLTFIPTDIPITNQQMQTRIPKLTKTKCFNETSIRIKSTIPN